MKFDICFLGLPKEIFFGVITDNTIAVKKCEKECNMLKIILVQGFCRLKIKITQFLAGFHFRHKRDVFEINSKPVFYVLV